MKWIARLLGGKADLPANRPEPDDTDAAAKAALARVKQAALQQLVEGRAEDAVNLLVDAADRHPQDAELHLLCGRAHAACGRFEAAIDHFDLALHYQPDSFDAVAGLAGALVNAGRAPEAEHAWATFLAARPDHAEALYELALLRHRRDDFEGAIALATRLTEVDPGHKAALNMLGLLVARELGDYARGERLLRAALAVDPGFDDARSNLGTLLTEAGREDEGIELLDEVLARAPGDDETRLARATAGLRWHRFERAWDDYEARTTRALWQRRPFRFPAWHGEPLDGRRLLVFAEQGLGDQIMFAGCIPDALGLAPRVLLECDPRLVGLFRRSFPGAEVVGGRLDEPKPAWLASAGAIDRQIAIGSLPRLFRRRLEDFPARRAYLEADEGRVEAWRVRLAAYGERPRIGVSWRGGTSKSRTRLRSLPLATLAPMLASFDATWVSLQYTDCTGEIADLGTAHGVDVLHWPAAIADYDETAALVCALDMVVTVCTSIVHLAGALGRPVLVMAPAVPEWRYGSAGDGMPWYPSARVIRQGIMNDWAPVIASVSSALCASRP